VYGSGQTVNSGVATVTVANPPPTIALTSPASGSSFTAPATVNLAASVTANGNTITSVQFYNGSTLLGEDTTSPYSLSWSGVAAGSYSVSARVVYGSGQTVNSESAMITVLGVPEPWQTADIGSLGVAGVADGGSDQISVKGAGRLGGLSDGFRFVYQTLSGDGEITVRLRGLENLGPDGRAGIMIRETLTDAARYAFVGLGSDRRLRWQFRSTTAGDTTTRLGTGLTPPDCWLKLVRAGQRLTAFSSKDGINWVQLGMRNMSLAANIQMGLAVSSGDGSVLDSAVFLNPVAVP
jgi:hypothetical protein